MSDREVLEAIRSVLRTTDNEAVRRVMHGAARYLEQKAATERVNRQVFVCGLAAFALAMGALFVALLRL